MSREARHCKNCIHCRAIGDESAGTLKIWCRLGMWMNTWLPYTTSRRVPFWYRTFRSVLKKHNRRLTLMAKTCPHFNQQIEFFSTMEYLSPFTAEAPAPRPNGSDAEPGAVGRPSKGLSLRPSA